MADDAKVRSCDVLDARDQRPTSVLLENTLEGLYILPELTALLLQATGDDLISCPGRNAFEMKGDLIAIFPDSVGADDIRQTDNRGFFGRCGDDQLDPEVAGRFFGEKGEHPAAAQVERGPDHLPRTDFGFLGTGDITGLDGNIDRNPEILA